MPRKTGPQCEHASDKLGYRCKNTAKHNVNTNGGISIKVCDKCKAKKGDVVPFWSALNTLVIKPKKK